MAKKFLIFLILLTVILSGCRQSDILVINKGSSNGSIINETTIINNYYGSSNETTYNVSSVQTVVGTSTTSDLNLLKIYDSLTWNITEGNGVYPIDFRMNFTGVTTFNKILMREQYLGGSGHEVVLQLYDYDSLSWESYDIITDQGSLVVTEIPVLDGSMHIDNGLVQVRFLHLGNGIPSHELFIDFIFLKDSMTTITNLDHDSLSNRDSICTNHPEVCLNYLNETQSDSRYLQSFTESDPVWNVQKNNYLNETQSDAKYLQSFTESDPIWNTDKSSYYTKTEVNAINTSMKNYVDSQSGGSSCKLIYEDELSYWTTARTNGIGVCAALSSGTAAGVTSNYIGTVRFSDSTTANGGYQCRSDALSMYFQGGEKFSMRFSVVSRATNIHQFGFSDSTTAADPTDGCWLSGDDLVFSGKCKNNAGPTVTASTYTLTAGVYYTAEIEALTSSSVIFRLYNADKSTLLWSDTVSANVPNTSARAFGTRIASWETSTNAAAIMGYFDYVKLEDCSWS